MNPQVDKYLIDGCGRCPLGGTPECKVHNWDEELILLREIILESELKEELKWGVPCYTFKGKNVLLLSALKGFVTVAFLKGSLLKDPEKLLVAPGANSQADRQFRFTSVKDIISCRPIILDYIKEAIEIEKAGLTVDFRAKRDLEYPEELNTIFEADPSFKAAFEALTPGRQRGYVLYFSAAKQSNTRTSRIEKYVPKILSGKGFHDR